MDDIYLITFTFFDDAISNWPLAYDDIFIANILLISPIPDFPCPRPLTTYLWST